MAAQYVQGWLIEGGRPDQGLPPGGVGIWPNPGHPDHSLPVPPSVWPGPGYPDQGLPIPPPGVWPPPTPAHPIVPIAEHPIAPGGSPGAPAHPIALPPGTVWPPTPGVEGKFVVLAGIPGVGWRYVVVDMSLRPDQGLPPHPDQGLPGQPGRPAQPIAPTPTPKA
jgi:hypothetical protein